MDARAVGLPAWIALATLEALFYLATGLLWPPGTPTRKPGSTILAIPSKARPTWRSLASRTTPTTPRREWLIETGKLIVGEAQAKIIDQDHYEYTVIAGTVKVTSPWTRQK